MSAFDVPARRAHTGLPLSVTLAAAALALSVGLHLVNFGAWDLRVRLLDSNHEWSLSHILATVAFAAGTVICALGATAAARRRSAWTLAAALFGVLLVDNVSRFHAHVPHWQLVYAPLLLALCAALLMMARGLAGARLVYAGVAVLCGSFAFHVLGHQFVEAMAWSPETWGYQIKVGVKEATELAGWILLLPALARLDPR